MNLTPCKKAKTPWPAVYSVCPREEANGLSRGMGTLATYGMVHTPSNEADGAMVEPRTTFRRFLGQ